MITRAMLLNAALAAGHQVARVVDEGESLDLFGVEGLWRPGADDGDALRLADALHLMVDMDERRVRVISGPLTHVAEIVYGEHDRMAINRLAIVTVAAQVGEAMA